MSRKQENTIGILYLLLASASWGFVASSVKTLTHEMDPYTISFSRHLLALLFFVVLFVRQKGSWRRLQWFLPWVLIGAAGRVGNYLLFNAGLVYAPSNAATISLPVQTVTTILLAQLLFGERMKAKLPGIALSLLGLAFLWWNGQGWETLTDPRYALGNILIVVSGTASAVHFLSQKALTSRMAVLDMLVVVFAWATLATLPFSWASGGLRLSYSGGAWALVLFLGIILTGASFLFLAEGYKRCTATAGVIVTNSSIFITLLLSRFLLHEAVSWMMVWGALLVMAGTLAVVQAERREIVEPILVAEQCLHCPPRTRRRPRCSRERLCCARSSFATRSASPLRCRRPTGTTCLARAWPIPRASARTGAR